MEKLGLLKNAGILFVVFAATTIAASAQIFTSLFSFDSTEGANPYAGLIQATDGNFYGTTFYGGANGNGTVFRITPAGALTTLYNFCARTGCVDGANPFGVLIQATDGSFYGTTYWGGAYYRGTIFKITSGGTLTTLHSFDLTEGANPYAGLIQATDGNFYGTTFYGGANAYGTVFKITAAGTLTTLHSFDRTNGAYPMAGLIQATDSNLYGTTSYGGTYPDICRNEYGCGTVYKITLGGILTTIHSFCAQARCDDGAYPYSGLVQGTDGYFYGTTWQGGSSNWCSPLGCGTLFRITSEGALTRLHSFCALLGCPDGTPYSEPLIQATDGNFYGTTRVGGGAYGHGTVFRITPTGKLTTLYNFCSQTGCPDGLDAFAGVIQATDGNFYGTTLYGGANGYGTIFRLAMAPLLTSSLNPSVYGQKVTLTAQVTSLGATGVVDFMWRYFTQTYTIGTATLNSAGVATLTKSNLNAYTYPLVAVYRGDANNVGGASAVLNQKVLQTMSAAALTSSVNPSGAGQAVTFTATITSPTVTPTGPVTFTAGKQVLGTVQIVPWAHTATLTTSTLPVGSTVIRVTYLGNSNIARSSAVLTQTVR